MKDANCPYCNEELDINHDDGVGYQDDESHEQHCSSCGKYFMCTTSIIYHYETRKADCLNDKDHEYEPTTTYPRCFIKMRCNMCGDERSLTEEEKIIHKIPSFDEVYNDLSSDVPF